MEKTNDARVREERLAAKLRENLKRRKAQARTMAADGGDPPSGTREGSGEGLADDTGDQ